MKKQGVLAGSIGALVLGGVLVASYGSGVAPAGAQTATTSSIIINKLNQILEALTSAAAGQNNHTLRWDTNNASATRFITAFTGAVLDKNTGLVWDQAPDGTPGDWFEATAHCVRRNVGGTVGWRLPSVVELKSVQDPSLPAPFVPASAFTLSTSETTPGVQSANYWSASTYANNPTIAWGVFFGSSNVNFVGKTGAVGRAWCVRGGMNADQY